MKRITEYDEELDREFDILQFTMADVKNETELFQKFAKEIFDEILKSLDIAINQGLPHVPCFAIDDAILHAENIEYSEKLEECMSFFLKEEDYLKCRKVSDLQKKLETT